MKPEDLITYCGLYGGCCARYRGYTVFREAARQGRELHTGKYYKIVISDSPPDAEK